MKKLSLFLTLTVLLLCNPSPPEAAAQFNVGMSCRMMPMVLDGFRSRHIHYSANGEDKLVEKMVDLYAGRLDPTKILLTDKEYSQLKTRLRKMIKVSLKGKDCSGLEKLQKDQISWQKDMEAFMRKETGKKGLKVNKKLELELDIDKRKRPKTKKEQTKLRRALMHFQLANYVANGSKLDEAKKKLVHRYELFTRRVKEQGTDDRFSIFVNAYASALDPHSTYFTTEDLKDFQIQMQLSLQGIGAVLTSQDGYTIVQEIVPGGAAARHGKLKPKDKIIAVAQGAKGEAVDVIDMSLRDVVKKIRGKKGSKVRLTVIRQGEKTERFEFTIERDKIDLKESAAKLTWRNVKRGKKTLKVAIIDLPSFYGSSRRGGRDSTRDVARLVEKAKAGKADAMVLDLSRNGGGLLSSAVEISGLFINSGAVVGVKDKKNSRDVLRDKDPRLQWDGPLVVLTSKLSASASEILAGALQDYGRAVIVGDKQTFGKGTVQEMAGLPPVGALKVTTALFYLPGGKSTQSIGVSSDIVIPGPLAELELGEKHQPNALAPDTTKAFKSKGANMSQSWKPVSAKVIKKLASKSSRRIKKDKEFKELQESIKKSKSRDTLIKIGEMLEDDEKNKKKKDEEESKKDKDKPSLQAREASEIAADLATEL